MEDETTAKMIKPKREDVALTARGKRKESKEVWKFLQDM